MIRSMTGFGAGRAGRGGEEIDVEIRSVNHKYCEVKARLLGTPNVSKYTFDTDDRAILDLGFAPDLVFDEGPSFGWVWSDIKLEVIP